MTQTTNRRPAGPQLEGGSAPGPSAAKPNHPRPVPVSPARHRRRPALIGVGVALVALGGLTSGWLVTSTGDTSQVLALARPVPAGQALVRADLVVADVRPDPSLMTVPAAQVSSVVGLRAAAGLQAGALLTPTSVTAQVLPGSGSSLVGVFLSPAQLPAEPLLAGDSVRIVDTPPAQADPPSAAPGSTRAQVVSVTAPDASGSATVDVLVPEGQAAGLAARAATGRISLVLDSRER